MFLLFTGELGLVMTMMPKGVEHNVLNRIK